MPATPFGGALQLIDSPITPFNPASDPIVVTGSRVTFRMMTYGNSSDTLLETLKNHNATRNLLGGPNGLMTVGSTADPDDPSNLLKADAISVPKSSQGAVSNVNRIVMGYRQVVSGSSPHGSEFRITFSYLSPTKVQMVMALVKEWVGGSSSNLVFSALALNSHVVDYADDARFTVLDADLGSDHIGLFGASPMSGRLRTYIERKSGYNYEEMRWLVSSILEDNGLSPNTQNNIFLMDEESWNQHAYEFWIDIAVPARMDSGFVRGNRQLQALTKALIVDLVDFAAYIKAVMTDGKVLDTSVTSIPTFDHQLAPGETGGPQVVSLSINGGPVITEGMDIEITDGQNLTLRVVFDKNISAGTLVGGPISLNPAASIVVEDRTVNTITQIDPKTFTFVVNSVAVDSSYQVILTTDIEGQNGLDLESVFIRRFDTIEVLP